MSPKFYWFLWLLFAVSAGVLWLAGELTMVAVVVFGFIAFGLVFTGMMCVLPGAVSHPIPKVKVPKAKKVLKPGPERQVQVTNGFSAYRSV